MVVSGLTREYDLGWKFERDTNGPPGYAGEPRLLLYISFRATTGATRPHGTLHYALPRHRWAQQMDPGEEDRGRLLELVRAEIPDDVAAVDGGRGPAWVDPSQPRSIE